MPTMQFLKFHVIVTCVTAVVLLYILYVTLHNQGMFPYIYPNTANSDMMTDIKRQETTQQLR